MLPADPLNISTSQPFMTKYVAYIEFTSVILFALFFYIYTLYNG